MDNRTRKIFGLVKNYNLNSESESDKEPNGFDSLEDPTSNNESSEGTWDKETESNTDLHTEFNGSSPIQNERNTKTASVSELSSIIIKDKDENSAACVNCNINNKNYTSDNIHLWTDPIGNHENFVFEDIHGINPEVSATLANSSPSEFFELFVDNQILQYIVDQTNLYANQVLISGQDFSEYSRLRSWEPSNIQEMRQFLGILGYMGIVKLPVIRDYWSMEKIFSVSVLRDIMSRNRFELLLKVWHFSDNEQCPKGDRGYKIEPLINLLIPKFQYAYTPGSEICIDETLIPYKGRLIMKQYLPQKTHKYCLNVFKLCSENGYTWNLKIYCGKEKDIDGSVPTNIVMKISEKLLNSGRTAITDNYFTSLELANKLLDKKTHLIGTLRPNRRGNPIEVIRKKLKAGELIAKENNRGICILKWKDRRDILILSTKHIDTTVTVKRHTGNVQKPTAICDYNKAKSSIDISDQMASYNNALRKTVKWYRKIALELLLGTAIVNAHFLYKKIKQTNMSITHFRRSIISNLLFNNTENNLGLEGLNEEPSTSTSNKRRRLNKHVLRKKEGKSHKVRKYCKGCYEKKSQGVLSKNQVTKVTTYCDTCDGQPHFCLNCFGQWH